jgi:hypothetical protein
MAEVRVEVTEEKLRQIGEPMMRAINDAQMRGFTIDEVLCTWMVMLGSAIKQRGGTLFLDKPLREALPPIAHGYEDMEYNAIDLVGAEAQAFRRYIEGAS